jgi:hypothetical protein
MAGQALRLDGEMGRLTAVVGEDDRFQFDGLPAGPVFLTVDEIRSVELTLDGVNGVQVIFAPVSTMWRGHVRSLGVQPGPAVIRVRVADRLGLSVRLWAEGWPGLVRNTGSKPEYGPTALEFAPLGPGRYTVEPELLGASADVELARGEIVLVRFEQSTEVLAPPQIGPWPQPEAIPEAETEPQPDFEHPLYLWVDEGDYSQDVLLAFLRFHTAYEPETGDDLAMARRSHTVILMSENPGDLGGIVSALEAGDSKVYLLDETQLAEQLEELIAFGLDRLDIESDL